MAEVIHFVDYNSEEKTKPYLVSVATANRDHGISDFISGVNLWILFVFWVFKKLIYTPENNVVNNCIHVHNFQFHVVSFYKIHQSKNVSTLSNKVYKFHFYIIFIVTSEPLIVNSLYCSICMLRNVKLLHVNFILAVQKIDLYTGKYDSSIAPVYIICDFMWLLSRKSIRPEMWACFPIKFV